MIIVEGADSTGKTTLARKICNNYGYTYKKWDQSHTYQQTIDWLSAFTGDPTAIQDVVCDRFPLFSEEVYGPLLRGRSKFSLKEQHNMYLLLQSMRPLIVLCNVFNEAGFSNRPQLPTLEQNTEALTLYQDSYKKWEQFFAVVTYSMIHPFSLSSLVSRNSGPPLWWQNMFKRSCAGMGRLGSPRYFILAESIGPRNRHHIPFEAGPSGLFLSEVLEATETPLSQVFITNYVKGNFSEAENQVALRTELEQTKPGRVIVMGSIARRGIPLIKYLGFPYRHVVHPSYWLRTGKRKQDYFRLFSEAKTGTPE